MDASPDARAPRPWARLFWLVPAIAFVGLLAFALVAKGDTPEPGDPAPDFEAELLEGGGTLALADLSGRPAVLNFWASWCGPCEDEAPLLKRAYETYGDEVLFVGINIKDAVKDALAFDERFGLGYPDVRDSDGKIYADYGLTGQPETFFLAADGTIFEHVSGPLSEDTLNRVLDELLTQR